MSQLDLANIVDVSTRHLSFVETSRPKPSREMVLRLAEHLDVPLRDRNQLLLAAGYAPVYTDGLAALAADAGDPGRGTPAAEGARAVSGDGGGPLVEPGRGEVVVQLRLAYGEHELTFLSTVTMFGTPLDITVSELVIESFFPADEQTADVLHGVTASRMSGGPTPPGSGSA